MISSVLFLFTFKKIKSLTSFILIYFLLIFTETILIYYANERFEVKYLRNIFGADYSSYPTMSILSICLVLLISVIFILYRAKDINLKFSIRNSMALFLLYIAISIVPIHKSSALVLNIVSESPTRNLAIQESTLYKYINDGPLVRLTKVGLDSRKGRFKKAKLQDKFDYLKLDDIENTHLGLKPNKKIIMVTMESISSSLIERFKNKSPSLMPNIQRFQKNYPSMYIKNTVKPTNNALTSMYCSHPNVELLLRMNYPKSFVNILKNQGFITAFYRSDPEYYDFGTVYLPVAGFMINRGKAFFANNGYHNYISNWGIPDRITFDGGVKFLEENKNRKVFLQIMTSDTHLPEGRTKYHDIKYPELPNWIDKNENREYLKSIYFQDYDIGLFIDKLITHQIYDEDTLIVITADHAPPLGLISQKFCEINIEMDNVPLIFISKRKVPEFRNLKYSCQLDIAPSILHLNNIRIPSSYWGTSLFELYAKNTLEVSFFKENIDIKSNYFDQKININEPDDVFEKQIVRLFNSKFE